jgi:hypothetical protein
LECHKIYVRVSLLTPSNSITPCSRLSVGSLLMQKLLARCIFTTKYYRELPIWLVETDWHGTVLNLIIMHKGMFVLPQAVVDISCWGWCSTRDSL